MLTSNRLSSPAFLETADVRNTELDSVYKFINSVDDFNIILENDHVNLLEKKHNIPAVVKYHGLIPKAGF